MSRITLATCALAAFAATPAWADPDCTNMGEPKPLWEIVRQFEEAGGKVEVAQVTDDQCYEIYGREGEKKVEIYYNPVTGEELEREES